MTDDLSEEERAERSRRLDGLHDRLEAGAITMRDYNRERLEILGLEPPPALARAPSSWSAAAPTKKATSWTKKAPEKQGSAEIHAPTGSGVGDGRLFAILFGFDVESRTDQGMLHREREALEDHVETLTAAGFTVVIHRAARREHLLATLEGKLEEAPNLPPAGFYWSSHGNSDGSLNCSDGGRITFSDVRARTVHPELRLAVLGACYVGRHANTWRKALGGHPLVVGWGRPVTISRAVDFLTPSDDTDHDFDDLVRRYLLQGTPIPPLRDLQNEATAPPPCRKAGLEAHVRELEGHLGVPMTESADRFELHVPLDRGRSRRVEVFVTDSARPFSEGEPLVGARSWVGPQTTVAEEASKLLVGLGEPGLSQVGLLQGEGELPELVTQGFLPLATTRPRDVVSLVHQVAAHGDVLAQRIFGTNQE